MNELVRQIEREQLKEEEPQFNPGDSVRVHVKVVEGARERVQVFEGIVMRVRGGGMSKSFTVRRVTRGFGVERTFLVHSPRVDRVEVTRHGLVRRAQLYYLRKQIGKAAKVKEKRRVVAKVAAK